jgi:plastocyanin
MNNHRSAMLKQPTIFGFISQLHKESHMKTIRKPILLTAVALSALAGSGIAMSGGYGGYGPGYGPGYGYPPPPPWAHPRHMGPMSKPGMSMGPGYAPARQTPAAPATDRAASSDNNARVAVQGMRFGSGTLTVTPGTTVEWVMRDQMPHTVTADSGAFDSGTLSAGGTFSHTFDEPGTHTYYCKLHPNMRGTVVVEG